MSIAKIKKLNTLPSVLESNVIYLINDTSDTFKIYITDVNGTVAKRMNVGGAVSSSDIINPSMTEPNAQTSIQPLWWNAANGNLYVKDGSGSNTTWKPALSSVAKLTTARSISATGDATWTVNFDGSTNATAALTLSNTGITAGSYPKVTVDSKGRVTSGASLSTSDIPGLNASKSQVLSGANNVYTSGGSYINVISWLNASYSTGTVTLDLNSSLNHNLTVSGNVTLGAPSNANSGKCGEIVINMTANATVAWSVIWKFLGKVPEIGKSAETWVISYKVLDSNRILATADKLA